MKKNIIHILRSAATCSPGSRLSRLLWIRKSLLGTLLLLLIFAAVAVGATTSSILLTKNELNFNDRGNDNSLVSSISYSGRFVTFDSLASNLDTQQLDSYNGWDIYLIDRNSNESTEYDETGGINLKLITLGSLANSRYPMLVRKPSLDPDLEGRFVVFQSDSSKFNAFNWLAYATQQEYGEPYAPIPDSTIPSEHWDPSSFRDIFLADLKYYDTDDRLYIYPISCSTDYLTGGVANGDSGSPGPFPFLNGNTVHPGAVVYLNNLNQPFVVFESRATNLVPGGTNPLQHIFVRDVSKACGESNSMKLLSQNANGQEADGNSTNPVVSSDGRFVAFVSYATNLSGDPDGSIAQVFLLDRDFDENDEYDELPPDGEVKYYLLSSDTNGVAGNGDSFNPSIGETPNGKIRVVFSSSADNLVVDDKYSYRDIFIAEVTPGDVSHNIKLISFGITGEQGNKLSWAPSISGDGLVASFTSYATNLVFNDNNYDCIENDQQINCPDIFTRVLGNDLDSLNPDQIWRTSLTTEGEESQANSGVTQLDGSGKYASFVTYADLVGDGQYSGIQQVYVRDHGNPPGNPIITPPSWKFLGVEPGDSTTQEFTLRFLGNLELGQISIQSDKIGEHFNIISDDCSSGLYLVGNSCTFSIQYSAKVGDAMGTTHRDNVIIPLPDDPRGNLYVALEGHVASVTYNPLIMID